MGIEQYRSEIKRNQELIRLSQLLELVEITDFDVGVPHSGSPVSIRIQAIKDSKLGDDNIPFIGFHLEEFLRAHLKELFKERIRGIIKELDPK